MRRAIRSATKALKAKFVPDYLGFPHISRDEVIEHHTRPLARELFAKTMTENPAILVLDGTYIYVQKSKNFSFSKRSYSLHKHRPLVKLMLVVTTTGYIVSMLGPYLADSKNSDANILKYIIKTNAERMKDWTKIRILLWWIGVSGIRVTCYVILESIWRCHLSCHEVHPNYQPRMPTVRGLLRRYNTIIARVHVILLYMI